MNAFLQGREALPTPFVSGRPGPRPRISRRTVASLLASGCPVAEVAEKVGCSRQHVWRLMRNSEFLGRALATAEQEIGTEADGRLSAMRPAVAEALQRELDAGNVRVMLWLAQTLGIGAGGYAPARYVTIDEPQALGPRERKELKQLRRDVAWYSSEIDRRDRLDEAERACELDSADDVA